MKTVLVYGRTRLGNVALAIPRQNTQHLSGLSGFRPTEPQRVPALERHDTE
jgi:hypothetical protein